MKHESGIFDDRAEAYKLSGDLLVGIARAHCKLDIDPMTHERWRDAMALMREIDTHADAPDTEPETVIQELRDYSRYAERYPTLSPDALGRPLHEKLVGRVDTILALGEFAAGTMLREQYIEARESEAYETVEAIGDLASTELRENPVFTRDFLPAVVQLGIAATLWDSAIDSVQDYRRGNLGFKPGPRYIGSLLKGVVQHGKASKGALFHVAPLAAVARKGVARTINRVRHGIPSYSTLRILGK